MYSYLFDAVFADSFFSPMRSVYVVSDIQLEEIKEKKKYKIKTIAFKQIVTEIPMILNFIPTLSESGFNFTSAMYLFFS